MPPLLGKSARQKFQNRTKNRLLKPLQRRKQQLQNQKQLCTYIVEGKEVWKPYREFGYNKNGKNPDPNSKRQKGKGEGKGGDCPKGNGKGNGQKGDNGEAPPNTAQETSTNQSIVSKSCVLGGANLRQLRDGLGLCSPGIIQPGERQRKTFWKAIRKVLSEVCGRNILTSELIRSADLLKVLKENF